jgi:hypothetical protein
MDDEFGREVVAFGYFCLARFAACQQAAFFE